MNTKIMVPKQVAANIVTPGKVFSVPPGGGFTVREAMVFLNGRKLVENIDYKSQNSDQIELTIAMHGPYNLQFVYYEYPDIGDVLQEIIDSVADINADVAKLKETKKAREVKEEKTVPVEEDVSG
jgi:hypothetical protein